MSSFRQHGTRVRVFIRVTDNKSLFALHFSSMKTSLLFLDLDVCGSTIFISSLLSLDWPTIDQEVYLPLRVALLVCKESFQFHRIR